MVRPRTLHPRNHFGRRLQWRYWTLTNDPVALPDNSTWQVMSHLKGKQDHFDQIGNRLRAKNLD
jgi:hypothetical protein